MPEQEKLEKILELFRLCPAKANGPTPFLWIRRAREP
jgi:hypothetical protein